METKVKDWPSYLDYPIQPKPDPRDVEIKKLKKKLTKLEAELEKEKSKNVVYNNTSNQNTRTGS
jgi:hypothetical protein